MDRRLILAVAGSGKTTFLINKLDLERRYLIVTYTDNNQSHLRRSIIEKFGYEPANISLLSFFQFLYRVCFRPFLKDEYRVSGISWELPPDWTRFKKGRVHYVSSFDLLYHNRISKLCLEICKDDIRERIEKFYDCFMIDEVQDLGGHDFNLITSIIPNSIDCLFVGDFYQHTFETSLDGNVNSGLYKNFENYKKRWRNAGIVIDETTLSNSYRCSPTTCDFVQQHIGIEISSHRKDCTGVKLVEEAKEAETLFYDDTKIKLFLQEANKYDCYATNWGASKGLDRFHDVCIVLNKSTLSAYKMGRLNTIPPSTKNKLYVACTRAKGDIYLIPHTFIDKFKKR